MNRSLLNLLEVDLVSSASELPLPARVSHYIRGVKTAPTQLRVHLKTRTELLGPQARSHGAIF